MRPNRLDDTFARLAARGEKALIAYLTAGDPNPGTSLALFQALAEGGADVLEIGLPFSDPLADGPVNQQAAVRALQAGTSVDDVLALARSLRDSYDTPLALLTYVNPVLRRGLRRFLDEAAEAGIDALVIPDLPAEEAESDFNGTSLAEEAKRAGVHLVPFAAPTTTDERLARLNGAIGGFVYCVSLTGVTGVRHDLPPGLSDLVARVKAHTDLPVAVGFGISTPEQAARVASAADAVIVGSALVREVETAVQAGTLEQLPATLRRMAAELKEGIQQAIRAEQRIGIKG